MLEFNPKEILNLLKNLCCSQCRNDFTHDSITIKEQEGDIFLILDEPTAGLDKICGKNFGDIVLNVNKKSKTHAPLEIIDGPPPITSDDVIDAHRFIKKMK